MLQQIHINVTKLSKSTKNLKNKESNIMPGSCYYIVPNGFIIKPEKSNDIQNELEDTEGIYNNYFVIF